MKSLMEIEPLQHAIPANRQGAKRHYGVHPYFTRRPYNVVRDYILHYSSEGDLVLDPFGGSGVTAIEAFLENRIGVQNDINPLANFIAKGIVDLSFGAYESYKAALSSLKDRCQPILNVISSANDETRNEFAKKVSLPENIDLPSNSDVRSYMICFRSVN